MTAIKKRYIDNSLTVAAFLISAASVLIAYYSIAIKNDLKEFDLELKSSILTTTDLIYKSKLADYKLLVANEQKANENAQKTSDYSVWAIDKQKEIEMNNRMLEESQSKFLVSSIQYTLSKLNSEMPLVILYLSACNANNELDTSAVSKYFFSEKETIDSLILNRLSRKVNSEYQKIIITDNSNRKLRDYLTHLIKIDSTEMVKLATLRCESDQKKGALCAIREE